MVKMPLATEISMPLAGSTPGSSARTTYRPSATCSSIRIVCAATGRGDTNGPSSQAKRSGAKPAFSLCARPVIDHTPSSGSRSPITSTAPHCRCWQGQRPRFSGTIRRTVAAQVQTVFRGETLRGLLLNAYGFWQMGQIMLIGAIVAFLAAAAMLILSLFGIAHRRHVPAEAEVFAGHTATAQKPAPAV